MNNVIVSRSAASPQRARLVTADARPMPHLTGRIRADFHLFKWLFDASIEHRRIIAGLFRGDPKAAMRDHVERDRRRNAHDPATRKE